MQFVSPQTSSQDKNSQKHFQLKFSLQFLPKLKSAFTKRSLIIHNTQPMTKVKEQKKITYYMIHILAHKTTTYATCLLLAEDIAEGKAAEGLHVARRVPYASQAQLSSSSFFFARAARVILFFSLLFLVFFFFRMRRRRRAAGMPRSAYRLGPVFRQTDAYYVFFFSSTMAAVWGWRCRCPAS